MISRRALVGSTHSRMREYRVGFLVSLLVIGSSLVTVNSLASNEGDWPANQVTSGPNLILSHADYVGGPQEDEIRAVVRDNAGDLLVTGVTRSEKFTTTPSRKIGPRGDFDVFVAKFSSTERNFLWVTFIGGTSYDGGRAIAVDRDSNILVTGETQSRDFPMLNAFQPECTELPYYGCGEAFILKLDATGEEILYSSYFGTSAFNEVGNAVAVDEEGNAWIATGGIASDVDVRIVKVGPGGQKEFARRLGGQNLDSANAITIDPEGGAVVAGVTYSDDFPTTVNAFQKETGGGTLTAVGGGGPFPVDAFVAKISKAGSTVFSSYLGGKGDEEAYGVSVDQTGDIFVVGETSSTDFPIKGAFQEAFAGPGITRVGETARGDAFVTKVLRNGEALGYSTFLGGEWPDKATGISVDNAGNALILGTTESGDFPELGELIGPIGGGECFLSKIDTTGERAVYSVRFGENCTGIELNLSGDPIVVGNTFGDLLASTSSQLAKPGSLDGFILHFTSPKTLYFAQFGNGGSEHYSSDIVLVNSSTQNQVMGQVEFVNDNGEPLEIGILGQGQVIGGVGFSVPPLAALTMSTDGNGSLKVGSIVVTSDASLAGVVRFNLPAIGIAGVSDSEPLSRFITPVRRQAGGINTGIAVVNTEEAPVTLSLSLRDAAGQEVFGGASTIESLPGRGHLAQFINELFSDADTSGFQGTLVVEVTGGRVAATALELGPNPGQFTTLPVSPLN